MITSFPSFPNLRTQRLQLRSVEMNDAAALSALRSDKKVNQFLERTPATSVVEAISFIQQRQKDFADGKTIYWAITLKDDDTVIGTICLWDYNIEKSQAEIGYELHPDYQGRGLMSEAVKAVTAFASANMKLNAITASVMHCNESSIHLLKKNHFLKDETYAYRPEDLPDYYDVYFLVNPG